MKRIQAKKHKIGTYEIGKISLSCFDDKRFVLDDGIHTLAYFHKDNDHWKILWWLKRIAVMEKYCNDWRVLWSLKRIVMIEKDCDD